MARKTPDQRNHGTNVSRTAAKEPSAPAPNQWVWVAWSRDAAFKTAVDTLQAKTDAAEVFETVVDQCRQVEATMRLRWSAVEQSYCLIAVQDGEGSPQPWLAMSVWHADLHRVLTGAAVLLAQWADQGGWPVYTTRADW